MAATGNEAVNLEQARLLFRRVMTEIQNKIGDSQDQMDQEISAAVAAEASAREKQDGLLQDAVDSKLQPDSLVAGDNVSIDKTSQPGRVVISATVGDAYVLPVATSAVLGGVKSGDKIKVLSDGTMDVGSGAITADKIADGVIPEIDLATDAEAKGFLGY